MMTTQTIQPATEQSVRPSTNTRPITIAIDASNVLFRLVHGLGDFAHVSRLTKIWDKNLAGMIQRWPLAHFVICFDGGDESARRQWLASYKSNRTPSIKRSVVERSVVLIQEMCIETEIDFLVPSEGCEADDLLALVVTRTLAADGNCVILSSDKDLSQLLSDGRVSTIRRIRHTTLGEVKEVEYLTASMFMGDTGLRPDQWRDYLTLVGDRVDCIPGCPDIGTVTAIKLLKHAGSIDQAIIAPPLTLPLSNNAEKKFRAWVSDPNGMQLARKLVTLYPPKHAWQPRWTS